MYGRSENIASMWRVAPSLSYTSGRVALQLEGEITTAYYGTLDFADKGKVKNTDAVTNNRLALSVSYFF
jgi:predicted neuraminidase